MARRLRRAFWLRLFMWGCENAVLRAGVGFVAWCREMRIRARLVLLISRTLYFEGGSGDGIEGF